MSNKQKQLKIRIIMAKKNETKRNQKTYDVTLTCIYNGSVKVRADNEDDALRKAEEMLDSTALEEFPDYVAMPNGGFWFGEASADYADEVADEDNLADDDDMSPNSDIVSDQCASGVVREYGVMFCNEDIFGDDEEHEYDVDCADGAAVAHSKDDNDTATLLLTYPKMDEVIATEDMVNEIRDYRGFNYDEKIHYGDIMMFCGKIVARLD